KHRGNGHSNGGDMDDKVNLAAALATFDEPFQPRIVGTMNDYKLMVAKTKGEFVWHTHPDTDDFFLVVSGRLTIQLRDRDVELGPGDMYVVPRGVEHRPRSDEGAEILLIEPMGTVTAGAARSGERTGPEQPLGVSAGPGAGRRGPCGSSFSPPWGRRSPGR